LPAEPPSPAAPAPLGNNGLPRGLRHDLINALNAVLGFASFLEADLPEGQPREFARRIVQAGRQAMALAERIPSSSQRASVRVLMVSAAEDADALALELESYGCDITPVPTAAKAVQALRKAPKAWDVVLADQPGAADHGGLREAAAAGDLDVIPRIVGNTAASLALVLRTASTPAE